MDTSGGGVCHCRRTLLSGSGIGLRRGRRGRLQREGFRPGIEKARGLLAQEPEKKTDIGEWFYVPSWKAVVHHGRVCGGRGVVGAVG